MIACRPFRTTMALGFLILAAARMPAQAPKKITFDEHIAPIIRDKCQGCHNADKAKGGLDASSFANVMLGGSSGDVVKPGDAEASRFYRLTAHLEEPAMPPKSPVIAKESLDLIKAWINGGAPQNAGSKVVVPEKKVEVARAVVRTRPSVIPMPTVSLGQVTPVKSIRPNAVTALAASPWAPLVAVASPKAVLLYNTDTLDLVGVLPFTHGQINVLKFSRSGELLLAAGGRGGKLGKVVLYEVKSGKVVTEVGDESDAILAADLSPDQTLVAVGGPNRLIRIYASADGHKVREIKKHTEWVTAIEFSPDGVLLATGDRNGGLQVWEANTGRDYFSLPGHKGAITDLSWRDDANNLVSSSEDGQIKAWEMEDGKQVGSVAAHGGGCVGVKIGHDNRLITAGRDLQVKLFDANRTEQKKFAGLTDLPLKVAISHDGGLVLVGDWTGVVKVWSIADGRLVGALTTAPPTPAERLQLATADVAAKLKLVEQAKAGLDTASTVAKAREAELAKVQKAAQDAAELAKQLTAQVVTLKATNDQATAEVATGQKKIPAAEAKLKAANEAATKAKSEADKAKDKPELAAKAKQAQTIADAAKEELTAARKGYEGAVAKQKETAEKLAAARKAAPEAQAKVKPAQDATAPTKKELAAARAKREQAQLAFEIASKELDSAKAASEWLKVVLK